MRWLVVVLNLLLASSVVCVVPGFIAACGRRLKQFHWLRETCWQFEHAWLICRNRPSSIRTNYCDMVGYWSLCPVHECLCQRFGRRNRWFVSTPFDGNVSCWVSSDCIHFEFWIERIFSIGSGLMCWMNIIVITCIAEIACSMCWCCCGSWTWRSILCAIIPSGPFIIMIGFSISLCVVRIFRRLLVPFFGACHVVSRWCQWLSCNV